MELGTYSATAKEFELIPAGIYDVRLDNIEITDKPAAYVEEGKDPKQWKWSFSINDGPQAGKTFIVWTNRTINKGSTAKPWVEALLSRNLVDGETLNSDDVLEQRMKAYLSEHTTMQGKIVNRIKDILDGPKPEPGTEVGPHPKARPVVTDQGGWPRRFLEAGNGIIKAKGWDNKKLAAVLRERFDFYVKFTECDHDQQRQVLGYVEDMAANPAQYDDAGILEF